MCETHALDPLCAFEPLAVEPLYPVPLRPLFSVLSRTERQTGNAKRIGNSGDTQIQDTDPFTKEGKLEGWARIDEELKKQKKEGGKREGVKRKEPRNNEG